MSQLKIQNPYKTHSAYKDHTKLIQPSCRDHIKFIQYTKTVQKSHFIQSTYNQHTCIIQYSFKNNSSYQEYKKHIFRWVLKLVFWAIWAIFDIPNWIIKVNFIPKSKVFQALSLKVSFNDCEEMKGAVLWSSQHSPLDNS